MKITAQIKFMALAAVLLTTGTFVQAQQKPAVIAYFAGNAAQLDSFDANGFTHIIYCFGHLQGNNYHLSNAADTALIEKMVGLKSKNPTLKVLLSLGGWGGCETCSQVFQSAAGRAAFAQSVQRLTLFLHTDGIDLDWEYPAIEGYPGHRFVAADKRSFTALVQELRATLGASKTLTFAAGGSLKYLQQSVDWAAVVPLVDYINLMTYDLTSGFSVTTGHHTPLYSNATQQESAGNAVQILIKMGVPAQKLVLGAAFYARTWEGVADVNHGLYQSGRFKSFIGFKEFDNRLSAKQGFEFYWDSVAQAPWAYNATTKTFATFDNKKSMALKTAYVLQNGLGGIMFWQLGDDCYSDGLLQTIDSTLHNPAYRQ